MICRVSLVQVVLDCLTALTGLHVRQQQRFGGETLAPSVEEHPLRPSMIRNALRRLENRKEDFPRMLAALLRGLDNAIRGRDESAVLMLKSCMELAEGSGAVPYALAARDALQQIQQPGGESELLRQRMLDEGVVNPSALEQLYTVRLQRH